MTLLPPPAPTVKSPVAVRYAWADNPECNLTNAAGLPAEPFRTDDWPMAAAADKAAARIDGAVEDRR